MGFITFLHNHSGEHFGTFSKHRGESQLQLGGFSWPPQLNLMADQPTIPTPPPAPHETPLRNKIFIAGLIKGTLGG